MHKLSHDNDKDCATFSKHYLQLVMMQKYADPKHMAQKDTDVKRYKVLNETYHLSNNVLSELYVIYIH